MSQPTPYIAVIAPFVIHWLYIDLCHKITFMEELTIDTDINVMYVTATSFPLGVGGAFDKLQQSLPPADNRMLYGISNPEKGTIVYKAAAEEQFEGEGKQYGLETFTIKKGRYIAETITGWKKDESSIGKTFQKLLTDKRIDPNGSCIEQYINADDVVCMVRLLRHE